MPIVVSELYGMYYKYAYFNFYYYCFYFFSLLIARDKNLLFYKRVILPIRCFFSQNQACHLTT